MGLSMTRGDRDVDPLYGTEPFSARLVMIFMARESQLIDYSREYS